MALSRYLHAIELNNEGALYLEAGKLWKAHNVFRFAIDAISQGPGCGELEEKPEVKFAWTDVPTLPLNISQPTSFVYKRAIRLPECKTITPDCLFESACIVWNMGLCLHLIGLAFTKSQHLKRASQMYGIVQTIRKAAWEYSQFGVLDLAVQNNLGQLHCEFLEYAEARQCFAQVSRNLAVSDSIAQVAPHDADGFVMNMIMAIEPSCSAAA